MGRPKEQPHTDELRDRVLHILFSVPAYKVKFTFDTISFHGVRFHTVTRMISRGKYKHGKGVGIDWGKLGAFETNPLYVPYDPDGVYDNMLRFPKLEYGMTAVERAGVVHEGMHAFLDITKATTKDRLTDESMAYIAGSLFYIRENMTSDGEMPPIPPEWDNSDHGEDFQKEAYRIAKQIVKGPSTVVTPEDVSLMRQKIYDNPGYRHDYDQQPNVNNNGVF